MLTWRWVRAGRDRFGRPVIPEAPVSIVREGAFCGDHGGSDSSSVVRRGRRQIWYPCLRMRMMMAGRVNRMVMPGRGVRRVITPTLGEALMTGRDGRIRGPRGRGRGTCSRRGARDRDSSRIVRLVIGGGPGRGRARRRRRWRPEAERARLPVVPGGAGSGGRIGRQIVIRRGVITPVRLMMVQGIGRRRIMRFLRMMRAVTPAALGSGRG